MEYASGGDIYNNMKQQKFKRYQEKQASIYITQVTTCLQYLHEQNIIHRDIKPENLLLVDGIIKLSDFGYSAHTPNGKRKTRCGTLNYFAYEIVQKQIYNNSIDIWCIGILAFELCAGYPPFRSKEQREIISQIKDLNIIYPEYFSIELIDFIQKIIVKDKCERMNIDQILNHKWIQMYKNL